MKRPFKAFVAVIVLAAIALTLTLALPASAGAKTGEVLWVCDPDGSEGPEDPVTFVSAPAAAEHGIRRADFRAGTIAFEGIFGEDCEVFRVFD